MGNQPDINDEDQGWLDGYWDRDPDHDDAKTAQHIRSSAGGGVDIRSNLFNLLLVFGETPRSSSARRRCQLAGLPRLAERRGVAAFSWAKTPDPHAYRSFTLVR